MTTLLDYISPATLVYVGFILLSIAIFVAISLLIERIIPSFKKEKRPFSLIRSVSFMIFGFISTTVALALLYWSLPAYMPKYTITDGTTTIVYQGMQHIGKSDYYLEVDKEVRQYREDGYTILREGVGSNGASKFSMRTCEMPKSDNFLDGIKQPSCIGGIMANDIYADISFEDLYRYFEKEAEEQGLGYEESLDHKNSKYEETITFLNDISNDRKNKFSYYAMKPYMVHKSFITRLKGGDIGTKNLKKHDDLLMKERNRVLAKHLTEQNNKKLYVFYGAAHFGGLMKILKSQNPNWKIVKTEYIESM